MSRFKEQGNLAFGVMFNICDLCKRCEGFRDNTDNIYKCKYNKAGRGVYTGIGKHTVNFKCKYFKRNAKFILANGMSKRYRRWGKGWSMSVKWVRGRFIIQYGGNEPMFGGL